MVKPRVVIPRTTVRFRPGPLKRRSDERAAVAAVLHDRMTESVVADRSAAAALFTELQPAPMEHVLLGNSFLSRFQMRRDNDVMQLTLK